MPCGGGRIYPLLPPADATNFILVIISAATLLLTLIAIPIFLHFCLAHKADKYHRARAWIQDVECDVGPLAEGLHGLQTTSDEDARSTTEAHPVTRPNAVTQPITIALIVRLAILGFIQEVGSGGKRPIVDVAGLTVIVLRLIVAIFELGVSASTRV